MRFRGFYGVAVALGFAAATISVTNAAVISICGREDAGVCTALPAAAFSLNFRLVPLRWATLLLRWPVGRRSLHFPLRGCCSATISLLVVPLPLGIRWTFSSPRHFVRFDRVRLVCSISSAV